MTMYTESLRAFLKPVLAYLDDDTVTEILINGPEDIWVERGGKMYRTDARFSEEGLLGAARNVAQFVGRPLTDERPRLDARLPDGSRIHVILAPIARQGTTLAIRKFFKDRLTVEALLERGSLSAPMARLVDAAIHLKLNVVVSGGTGSGKTTLLNVVSALIPESERIVVLEDSAELQIHQRHQVSFESRPPDKLGKGEVNLGDLLLSALRLRPDRIVVGEVRGGECFHLIQAMNTGHGGSLSTCHANSPIDTLRRLESLCLMSAVELPLVAVRAQVASAIQLIICCERLPDGERKVTAISEVLPLNDKGEYRTQDLFVFTPVARDGEGKVLGYHAPTGVLPTFLGRARAYGFADLDERFFDPATYQVPPPPLFHAGEEPKVRWAGSLKHREKGLPDAPALKQQWAQFEQKLKAEGTGRAPPAPVGTSRAPSPAPFAPTPARPSTRPPPPVDDDKTPLPARAPRGGRGEAEPLGASDVDGVTGRQPVLDEPKVELSEELLQDVVAQKTEVRPAPRTRPADERSDWPPTKPPDRHRR